MWIRRLNRALRPYFFIFGSSTMNLSSLIRWRLPRFFPTHRALPTVANHSINSNLHLRPQTCGQARWSQRYALVHLSHSTTRTQHSFVFSHSFNFNHPSAPEHPPAYLVRCLLHVFTPFPCMHLRRHRPRKSIQANTIGQHGSLPPSTRALPRP